MDDVKLHFGITIEKLECELECYLRMSRLNLQTTKSFNDQMLPFNQSKYLWKAAPYVKLFLFFDN
jgi:hypothetical protein